MKQLTQEALIKGVFTPEQAKEVLIALFRSKIQMHSLSSFSTYVKTGKDSTVDNSRKQELKESLERLTESINSVDAADTEVKLDCQVKMRFVKRKQRAK